MSSFRRFEALRSELDAAAHDLSPLLVDPFVKKDSTFVQQIRQTIRACLNLSATLETRAESFPHIDWEAKAMLVVAAAARVTLEYLRRKRDSS